VGDEFLAYAGEFVCWCGWLHLGGLSWLRISAATAIIIAALLIPRASGTNDSLLWDDVEFGGEFFDGGWEREFFALLSEGDAVSSC